MMASRRLMILMTICRSSMKHVVRSALQFETYTLPKIREAIETYPITVEWKEYKPPRTLSQNRKVHAMLTDLANFTGDKNIKQWIKQMEFWPQVYVEHFGQGKTIPKSEADLEREESSIVIDHLYMIGADLTEHGFMWSHND